MRFALFKHGGMAEWLKAARLKRDSRKLGRGFGDPQGRRRERSPGPRGV